MCIIPPLRDFSHSEPYRFLYSFAGIFPIQRPNSAVGIFSSQDSNVTAPLMGFPHTEVTVNPTLLLGLSHSEDKNLLVPLMGLPPFGNIINLSNHPQAKWNILELKTCTPRRDDQFQTTQVVK